MRGASHGGDPQRPPGLNLFLDGCPGGETQSRSPPEPMGYWTMFRKIAGDALVFSSGHFLKTLAARWLGLEPAASRYFC